MIGDQRCYLSEEVTITGARKITTCMKRRQCFKRPRHGPPDVREMSKGTMARGVGCG